MTAPARAAVFEQTFSGPAGSRDAAVTALTGAEFDTVEAVDCPYVDDGGEAAKGWIRATNHRGGDPTDPDTQLRWMDTATEVLADLGYELRLHGVVATRATEVSP